MATGSGTGPRYVDYVLGILKTLPPWQVQVRSRPNCSMKPASSSASRVTNTAPLPAVVVVPAGWTPCRSSCGTAELPVWLLPDQTGRAGWPEEVKLCVAYRMPDGREVTTTPLAADDWKGVEPIYETMPGWSESAAA